MTLSNITNRTKMTILSTIVLIFSFTFFAVAESSTQPFITTWKTDNPGTSGSTSITIPTEGTGYNYDVDWNNDGVFDEFGLSGDVTHDFGAPGTYTIGIRGDFPRIYFYNSGEEEKIISIDQWGDIAWKSMVYAFHGAKNMTYNALDAPDLSNLTNLSGMFYGASSFNGNLNSWDLSNVTSIQIMFLNATSFTGDVSSWDVSNVIYMGGVFHGATYFNGDISNWDVSNVTNMSGMFQNATSFNGDISNWDVSNVTSMRFMFNGAVSFNGDLSNWNVGKVTNMMQLFNNAKVFNSDISNWDVSNVTNMVNMFLYAFDFNRDLNSWDVSKVTDMSYMFRFASSFNGDISSWNVGNVQSFRGMFWSATSFNGDISNWDVSNVTDMSFMFHSASSFNSDLSNWDVSNVTDMWSMFKSAYDFNSDISGWDVSNVHDMRDMFGWAHAFNADISNWDVNNIANMSDMFWHAYAFNQNLGNWDISNVTDMTRCFDASGLDVTNYDNTLIGWESQGVNNINLGASGLKYCLGENARSSLVNSYGWTITGDQKDCSGYNKPPVAICKNVAAEANVNCEAIAIAEDFNNDSHDPDEDPLTFTVQPSGPFPLGVTMVTLTVTDPDGEFDQCQAYITVTDTEPPQLTAPCPDNMTFCGAQNVFWSPPTATDNCGIVSTINNYDPGYYFDVGNHTVDYEFFDAAGLSASCNFTITIHPNPDIQIVQSDLPTWCQGIQVLTVKIFNPGALQYPLVFEWSDHPTGDPLVIAPANGMYSVTVTDALGCVSDATTIVDEDISSLLSAYTVIAEEEFEMQASEVHGGGVGIEDAEEGQIGDNTSVFSFLRANMNQVNVDASSFINGIIDDDLELDLPNFRSNPYRDNNNVTVSPNTTMTLYGSRFGNINVTPGATLIFESPEVFLQRLTTGNGAKIIFTQPTEMMIRRKMSLGRSNIINPDAYTSVIYVNDDVTVREGSELTVNIFAADKFEVNETGNPETTYMTGMFIGEEINSGENVIWNWDLNCDYIGISSNTNTMVGSVNEEEFGLSEVETTKAGSNIKLYPNPTSGLVNIEIDQFLGQSVTMRVYDSFGREIIHNHFGQLEIPVFTIDMTGNQFASGIYQISIKGEKEMKSIRVILNK